MKRLGLALLFAIIAGPATARSQSASARSIAQWNEGAADCHANPQSPLEVHSYDSSTFVLRESLCETFEAPFMYLLIGTRSALLIDDGDVSDAGRVPLADTVLKLLPHIGGSRVPLLVAHTHRHIDHRAGDAEFAHVAGVRVVGYDLASVRRFYHFTNWPNGIAQIDLGDRVLDVIPTPGHNETHISFYDRNTALFFSGDFMLPGRMLIDDASAERGSARRVAAFVRDRPVAYVLGGHIELDSAGGTFSWGSTYHPHEHVLPMTRADLLALPAAANRFNGFYSHTGTFLMMNSIRVLVAECAAILLAVVALIVVIVRFVRARSRRLAGERAATATT